MNSRRWLLAWMLAACFVGVSESRAAAFGPPASPREFTVRGVVREIAEDRKSAVIRHEEIPGYMPKMTMELYVREPKELTGIKPGDHVTFRLTATDETHWIDKIQLDTKRPREALDEPDPKSERSIDDLKPGDPLPDIELVDENGRPTSVAQFRGHAVAFTFIFTRCPLPDFCPLMNRHFGKARSLLLADDRAPANWQFLSISFDPEFDQPEVLARYARSYRGNSDDRWLFAAISTNGLGKVAAGLDLMVNRQEGSFSHNLRTVVIDTRGRIHRQFDGNRWKPEELAESLRTAAAVP